MCMKLLLKSKLGREYAAPVIGGMLLLLLSSQSAADENSKNATNMTTILLDGQPLVVAKLEKASYATIAHVQAELEREARSLIQRQQLDEAVLKYKEALHPVLIRNEADRSGALWGILQIHQWQGKFELALEELQWFLKARPDKDYYIDKKFELEALIKARDTGSNQPVYEFIEYMKKKWASLLPPKGSNTYTDSVLSPILQLYEYMGDYDSGMAYVDEILDYEYNRTKIKKVFTSAEADQRMQDLQQRRERGWQDYKAIRDWLRIREGFEQDKREGTKGRALRAILDSDIIPW